MLSLASRLAALISTALGWCLIVVVPALAFIGLPGSFLLPPGDLSLFEAVLRWSLLLGAALLVLNWLPLRLMPPSIAVGRRFPGSKKVGRGLWVAPSDRIQAYALACGGHGAIILTDTAMRLPKSEVRWIIEHERSHLRQGDAAAALWWVAGNRTMMAGLRFAQFLFRLLRPLPPLGHVAFLYYKLSAWALRVSFSLFRLLDRHLGRAMEYRADRDAAKATSPLDGAMLLRRLSYSLEPSFSLFASHPPTPRRIKRMERMARREAVTQ